MDEGRLEELARAALALRAQSRRSAGEQALDLRHSFASLLLAEGRTVHYVAGQFGHGAEQTLRTYGHVIAEYADRVGIVAEDEIRVARGHAEHQSGPSVAQIG